MPKISEAEFNRRLSKLNEEVYSAAYDEFKRREALLHAECYPPEEPSCTHDCLVKRYEDEEKYFMFAGLKCGHCGEFFPRSSTLAL
jgi:hydrogenase maturation factor HypF (carbamoyltransferase family)